MKGGERAAAMVLAIGMVVTGSMALFAANDKDLVEGNCGGVTDGKADSALTGTIKIINTQVKVPTATSFDINPNVVVAADVAVTTSNNQIIAQASNYIITSTSKVPLVVSTTGVKTRTGPNEDTPTLVNKMDDLTGENMMFAICKSGDSIKYPSAATGSSRKWMTIMTVITDSLYRVASTAGDNALALEGTLNMTLYGATGAGWKNGDSFQIIPIFTIALQSS